MHRYHRKTKLNAPPAEVFAFHASAEAFAKLTPPNVKMDVLSHGGITDGAIADLRIYPPPLGIPLRWTLRHEDYMPGKQFVDRQISGPFRSWKHVHSFDDSGDGGCIINDMIEFELPLPVPLVAGLVKAQLDQLFDFREEVLAREFGR